MTRFDVMDILILWTFIGLVGLLFGFHVGWWDVLVNMGLLPNGWLPADPRRT